MKIEVDPNLMVRLNGYAIAARDQEFSGLGFCELRKDVIWVYDFVMLDVGTEVFTEIPASELLKLMDRPDYKNMKVFVHKHPMGDGVPGIHNWSGTDNTTIMMTPLGGVPEMVRWSVSMVLTLGGWVGRIDNYITHKTLHLEVSPNITPLYGEVKGVLEKKAVEAKAERERKAEEKSKAVEAMVEAILSRVGELDESVLKDLGITREDLAEIALQQKGIYNWFPKLKQGKKNKAKTLPADDTVYAEQLELLNEGYTAMEIEEMTGEALDAELDQYMEPDDNMSDFEINEYIVQQRRGNGRSY